LDYYGDRSRRVRKLKQPSDSTLLEHNGCAVQRKRPGGAAAIGLDDYNRGVGGGSFITQEIGCVVGLDSTVGIYGGDDGGAVAVGRELEIGALGDSGGDCREWSKDVRVELK